MNSTKRTFQTIDQRRAEHAWNAICQIDQNPRIDKKKIGGHARRMPARIVASGLGQALAFVRAKQEADVMLTALGEWVIRIGRESPDERIDEMSLLHRVMEGSAARLRRDTDQALAWLSWFRRFAEAKGWMDDQGD